MIIIRGDKVLDSKNTKIREGRYHVYIENSLFATCSPSNDDDDEI